MSNSYKFIDPDYTYTDPKTGLLRNLQDITDPEDLAFVESGVVTKRLQELYEIRLRLKELKVFLKFTNIFFKTYTLGQGKPNC